MAAPVFSLETERLQLRPVTEDDFEFAIALYTDPEVGRYLGPRQPLEHYRQRLEGSIEHQRQHGFSRWMAVLKRTGERIGRCGPMILDIAGNREVELGYAFLRSAWGHGYATEAARASLDYVTGLLNANRVVAMIDPPNAASIRVARKLGMLFERHLLWDSCDVELYTVHPGSPPIRQADAADLSWIANTIAEAAQWLTDTGQAMWSTDELDPGALAADVSAGLFYVAEVSGQPAGVVRFQLEDPLFWPDAAGDSAAYIHRLVVARAFAGQGISTALLRWAVDRTRRLNRDYLRLDCEAARTKLRSLYEAAGFTHHSDRQVGPYFVSRYQVRTGGR